MAIFNLTENADIWWQDIKRVKNLKDKYLTWRVFKNYFKRKLLSEQYYEERVFLGKMHLLRTRVVPLV